MLRPVQLLVSTCLFLVFAMSPTRANAQDGQADRGGADRAAAQGLFDEGMIFFRANDFKQACNRFEASLKLVNAIGSRGKLAECYEKSGRTASAWAMYREVAVLATRQGQARRAQVATARAKRLQAQLATLTIVVSQESQELSELVVTRDRTVVEQGAYGSKIAIDPGTYEIRVRAPGYKEWSKQVQVEPTSSSVVEIPALEAVAPLVIKTDEVDTRPDIMVAEPLSNNKGAGRIIALGGMGAGGALLVTGVVLGIQAKSDYDAAFDNELCNQELACTSQGLIEVGDARSRANVGTLLALTGVVIAGASAYLWFLSGEDAEDAEDKPGLSLSPTANQTTLGWSLQGAF